MGLGPIPAVPKALAAAGIELADVGVIESNEAFAAQNLAVSQELVLILILSIPMVVRLRWGILLGLPVRFLRSKQSIICSAITCATD